MLFILFLPRIKEGVILLGELHRTPQSRGPSIASLTKSRDSHVPRKKSDGAPPEIVYCTI